MGVRAEKSQNPNISKLFRTPEVWSFGFWSGLHPFPLDLLSLNCVDFVALFIYACLLLMSSHLSNRSKGGVVEGVKQLKGTCMMCW
jgi:hypothetical protein